MEKSRVFIKNPALAPLNILVGKWDVMMTHTALPAPLSWQDSIDWLEDAFLIWHWQGKDEVPRATSIISRNQNEESGKYVMFYYDSRGVSRIFEMSFKDNIWKFWREDSDFFQRFEGKISEDGNVIIGKGENSEDGREWEHDYDITYKRI